MTHQFGVGPINDADEPFQPRLQQAVSKRLMATHVQKEARNARVVAESFIAVRVRGANALDLHVTVPVRSGRNGARMRAEPDQGRLFSKRSRQSWPMFSSSRTTP